MLFRNTFLVLLQNFRVNTTQIDQEIGRLEKNRIINLKKIYKFLIKVKTLNQKQIM